MGVGGSGWGGGWACWAAWLGTTGFPGTARSPRHAAHGAGPRKEEEGEAGPDPRLSSCAGGSRASVLGAEPLPGGDPHAGGYKDDVPVHPDPLHPPAPHLPGHQLVTSPCCGDSRATSPPCLTPGHPVISQEPCSLPRDTVRPGQHLARRVGDDSGLHVPAACSVPPAPCPPRSTIGGP